jgi:hypothetical protein
MTAPTLENSLLKQTEQLVAQLRSQRSTARGEREARRARVKELEAELAAKWAEIRRLRAGSVSVPVSRPKWG